MAQRNTLKRSPLKHYPKRHNNEAPGALEEVWARGVCEICRIWFGLEVHHDPPKRMGGTTKVYTAEEMWLLCHECHKAVTDNRIDLPAEHLPPLEGE